MLEVFSGSEKRELGDLRAAQKRVRQPCVGSCGLRVSEGSGRGRRVQERVSSPV